ncbi:F-box domain-containing protein [Mycena venus]|uniref:F-box domain-containing protein n=1 Tax=Mycena venus TaxID=2733690 RepID=A0A8H6XS71_9AGAR|nr:F-box domain-containing protein [Mycena venus]
MPFQYPEEISPRLQKHCARLRELDRAIPELEAKLDRLLRERRALRREVRAYPILTLPNELTTEIFINCLSPGRVMPHPRTPPLLLAQVCRKWREIAFSVPELWNSIRPRRVSDNTVRLLDLWSKRAGILPISISLSLGAQQHLPPSLPSWASTHSNRWENVSLVLSDADLIRFNWMDVSALKTLVIGRGEPFGTLRLHKVIRGFERAKHLREVTLLRGLGPSNIDLKWDQLTTLSATDLTVRECVDALRSASRLTRFTVYIRTDTINSQPIHPKLRHSRLQQLILKYGAGHIDLLRRLELPSLTRVQLSLESGAENLDNFIEFGAQALLLQHLSVEAGTLSPTEILRCLTATPAVTMLEFHSPFRLATAQIWRGLTPHGLGQSPATVICLPALTHLRMTDEGGNLDDAAYTALAGMLTSRNGQGAKEVAKLRLLSLMLLAQSNPPNALVVKQLDDLRGMDIDICIETRNQQLYPANPLDVVQPRGCNRSFSSLVEQVVDLHK